MPAPGAGRLRSRVLVQACALGTPTTTGQTSPSWSTVATVWAEVLTTGGDEGANADQQKASVTTKITLRQNPLYSDLAPGTHRIVYNNRIYNLTSVIKVDNLNAFYEVLAKQVLGPQGAYVAD